MTATSFYREYHGAIRLMASTPESDPPYVQRDNAFADMLVAWQRVAELRSALSDMIALAEAIDGLELEHSETVQRARDTLNRTKRI